MTKYTTGGSALPYPEGGDRVAVSSDIQRLAFATDTAIASSGTWQGVIATGGDLNTATGSRGRVNFYEINASSVGTFNLPPGISTAHLEVLKSGNNRRLVQRVTSANADLAMWVRNGLDPSGTDQWTFSPWQKVQMPGDGGHEQGQIVSEVTAGHRWTAGPTVNATYNLNDTSQRVVGDRVVTMTTDGTGKGNSYLQLANLNLDLTGKGLTLWVQATNRDSIQSVELSVASGLPTTIDAGVYPSVYIHLPLSSGGKSPLMEGEWFPIHVSLGNATGSTGGVFDRASVKTLRITMRDTAGMPAPTLRIGGVGTFTDTTPRYPKGVITLMFDDSYESDYTLAAPRLAKYGFAATAYPIYSRIGTAGCVSMRQLRELKEVYGWEIGAHASNDAAHSDWRDKSPEWLRTEFAAQKKWQEDNNFPTDTFAYPYGPFNAEMARQASNYYTSARSTYGWVNSAAKPAAYRLPTRTVGPTTTPETIIEFINRAKVNGGWLPIMFHRLVDAESSADHYTVGNFEKILAAVAASGMAVDVTGNVIKHAF